MIWLRRSTSSRMAASVGAMALRTASLPSSSSSRRSAERKSELSGLRNSCATLPAILAMADSFSVSISR